MGWLSQIIAKVRQNLVSPVRYRWDGENQCYRPIGHGGVGDREPSRLT